METGLLGHAEQKAPTSLQKCILGLVALLIIFQAFVLIFIFTSGYVTLDNYKLSAQNIMDKAVQDVDEGLTQPVLPTSFVTPYQLPRYCQYNRGTCWALATIGLLEQSYRDNGIRKGFLKENEYLRLSPQAYAIDVLNQCALHPEACPGKQGIDNSTEGGYVEWLYAFTDLYDKVIPESACPYAQENEGQWECVDKEKKQASNPIKFNVTSITTKRNIYDVKKLLFDTNKPVAFDSSLIIGQYAIPTAGHEMLRAFVKNVDNCPNSNNEECMYLEQHEMNPDGEFFIEDTKAASEGGHAMNIVGYNDHFVNKDGTKGAFIVRNSWLEAVYDYDANQWIFPEEKQRKKFNVKANKLPPPTPRNYYRGSHSSKYIMQEISEWDERILCPNPNNIQNWDSCVNLAVGPTKQGVRQNIPDSSACFNQTFMMEYAKNYRRPMEFRCLNQFTSELCSEEDLDGSRFFLTHKSQSIHNPNLVNFCMLRVNKTDITQQKEFCANDVPFDYVEFLFMPTREYMDLLQNNEDYCGFHIWPYSYIERNQKYRGFFDVIHFDITWDDRSYLANKEKGFDYQYIDSSTKNQADFPEFIGPEPYQKRFTE
ncbi:hypothetical protein ENUP19_0340G0040 [Entamoeba nuttalli]|uniref:Peptidase C1A papain C-terminal domain-containing protein n=1 Tax=Entamoeba nuttalli TaxID=412467 RepID=A0ABQ0DX79_9EUKA